jgi:hypothetical protein
VVLATFQAVLIIAIQAAIAYDNTDELKSLLGTPFGDIDQGAERFNRMRWENIAFCGFQLWFCAMAFDAVCIIIRISFRWCSCVSVNLGTSTPFPRSEMIVSEIPQQKVQLLTKVYTFKVINQNIAEVLAIFVFNLICAILGALEILDDQLWIGRLAQENLDVTILTNAEKIEIVLAVILPIFALIFALPSYKITKQLGWTRYKKIGGDLAIDSRFFRYRWF